MAIPCSRCGRQYDVTLFQFGHSVHCDCGATVSLESGVCPPASRSVTRLILARHAETDWNREKRIQGQTDIPLNATGVDQARALAAELQDEPIAEIYSSDRRRCIQTAQIINEPRHLLVHTTAALREADYGEWEGKTQAELKTGWPELYQLWLHDHQAFAAPGGESFAQLQRRVVAEIERIAAEHEGKTVLVVTHGGPCLAFLTHALGRDPVERDFFALRNGAFLVFEKRGDQWEQAEG